MITALVVVAFVSAGIVGCSSESAPGSTKPLRDEVTQASVAHQHANQTSANPADLRATLERLLAQHAILTVRLTRARLRNDADLAQTAEAALGKNTTEIGALVGSMYGPDAAKQFEQVWSSHVASLFNYARGVADKDQAVTDQARRELTDYTVNLSRFVQDATKQADTASVIRTELQKHAQQLLDQTDAYAQRDYARAFSIERESYAHMFPLGKVLATAFVTGGGSALPTDFDSPAQQLRSRLGMLLGEHAELAVDAMRSGVANLPDFQAAATALDGNTQEITAAIEGLFGGDSAKQFQTLWGNHIDAFIAYTQATGMNDPNGKKAAREQLQQFNTDFAGFLSTSTEGRLAAPTLGQAFVMHEDLLIQQIDAYAQRDFETAHRVSYDAFQHMFALAADAATAIGDTVAARSPKGGAQTGKTETTDAAPVR